MTDRPLRPDDFLTTLPGTCKGFVGRPIPRIEGGTPIPFSPLKCTRALCIRMDGFVSHGLTSLHAGMVCRLLGAKAYSVCDAEIHLDDRTERVVVMHPIPQPPFGGEGLLPVAVDDEGRATVFGSMLVMGGVPSYPSLLEPELLTEIHGNLLSVTWDTSDGPRTTPVLYGLEPVAEVMG